MRSSIAQEDTNCVREVTLHFTAVPVASKSESPTSAVRKKVTDFTKLINVKRNIRSTHNHSSGERFDVHCDLSVDA